MKGYDIIELKDDTTSSITIKEANEKAGLNSCYQIMLYIAAVFCSMPHIMLMYSFPNLDTFPRVRGCQELGPSSLCPNATTACSRTYTYEDKHLDYITEYNLICDPARLSWISRSYYIGGALSCLLGGILGDILGRLQMICILICIAIMALIIQLMVPNYSLLLIALFVCGGCQTLITTSSLVIISEAVHPRNMYIYLTLWNSIDPFARLVAQLLRLVPTPWRIIHVFICICSSLFFLFMIWLRESPRFLFSKSRDSEALNNLRHIGRMNDCLLPDKLSIKDIGVHNQKASGCGEMMRLLRQGWVLKRLIPLLYLCLVLSLFVYVFKHDLSMVSPVPKYQGFIIVACCIVSYLLSVFLYPYIGCGQLLIGFGLCTIGLIMYYFVPQHPRLQIGCYMVCLLSTIAVFNVISILAALSYPTAIKNLLIGWLLFCFCFGALFPPFFNGHYTFFIWFEISAFFVGLGVVLYVRFVNFEDPEP